MKISELGHLNIKTMESETFFSLNIPCYNLTLAEEICKLALEKVKENISDLLIRQANEIKELSTKELRSRLRELGIDPDTVGGDTVKNQSKPYLIKYASHKFYNPDYGDDRICKCGHSYYEHFDPHCYMSNIGCMSCSCPEFNEAKENLGEKENK